MAGVDVRHYDLVLRLDPETRRLDGRAVLEVQHPETLGVLTLGLDAMTVDTVRVEGVVVAAEHEGAALRIPLGGRRAASRVEIVYRGTPSVGLYARRHGEQRVVFTDSWPDEGRGWMPGVHHPSDPATLALSLTLPRGVEAAATGTLHALDTLGAHVRYRWRLDAPVPAYTFAFAVADFAVVEDAAVDSVAVRYRMLAADSGRAALLRRTPQALAFFADLLGPYPFAAYEAVQVPIRYAGMENASAVFLDAALFDDPYATEEVQIHELAHQWFGNRVPIERWADLWLSEGAATYLTTLFYEHADGLDTARRRWIRLAVPRGGPQVLVPPPPVDPEAHLTWVPYEKGASVLHLLRRALGDEAFFAALRDAYQQHAGNPLSTDEFQTLLEERSGRDLDALFDFWVYGGAVPTLTTTWDAAARTLAWHIEGDAGTLAGVPFELRLRQGNEWLFVDATAGRTTLPDWSTARPEVEPVGVMLRVK